MAHPEAISDPDPLCCCEYINVKGERAHLCGLLCDCSELDEAADKLFTGRGVSNTHMGDILGVAEDRMRLPWKGGAKKVQIDLLAPWILVPLMLKISALHWATRIGINLIVLPLFLYCKFRTCLKIYRPKTKFFASWSLATTVYLLYIYEYHVVGLVNLPKIVSPLENFCLIGLMCTSAFCVLLVRRRQQTGSLIRGNSTIRFCRACGHNVYDKDHHCVWIDACITSANWWPFMAFVASTMACLIHAGLLLVTSVCLPVQLALGERMLIPQGCSEWNGNFTGDLSLTLSAGMHCLGIASLLFLMLIVQMCFRRRPAQH